MFLWVVSQNTAYLTLKGEDGCTFHLTSNKKLGSHLRLNVWGIHFIIFSLKSILADSGCLRIVHLNNWKQMRWLLTYILLSMSPSWKPFHSVQWDFQTLLLAEDKYTNSCLISHPLHWVSFNTLSSTDNEPWLIKILSVALYLRGGSLLVHSSQQNPAFE